MATAVGLRRTALRLEYATLAWMTVEAAASITAGLTAGSIALLGFGLDSVVELASAAIVIWQLNESDSGIREHRAHRLIALSLYGLAAYVAADAAYSLATNGRPEHSSLGIAVTCVALLIMPSLARAKKSLGARMHNAALVADASESSICAYLSAVALTGLALNAGFGWWWADPVAALGIAAFAVREGREAWQGHECC